MLPVLVRAGTELALPLDHGRFRWDVENGTTEWSESVYRLHGHRLGRMVPSAAVALGHKHPDDLHGCIDALHAGMLANRLVVHEHRLVDTAGRVRQALMVARPVCDRAGVVKQLCGFLLPFLRFSSRSVSIFSPMKAAVRTDP